MATLTAPAAPPAEVFAEVREVGRLAVDSTVLSLYNSDDGATIVGTWNTTGSGVPPPIGSTLKLAPPLSL